MKAMSDDGVTQVYQFDGQTVWLDRGTPLLEVGNFLGGGAAGTVYECEHTQTHEHYALKILNPLGFKLIAPALLRKCMIVYKGEVLKSTDREKEIVDKRNVWWLLDGSTKQHIAAYYSERQNCLKDLSLNQCIQVWGTNPRGIGSEDEGGDARTTEMQELVDNSTGVPVRVPFVPSKYADFVRRRSRIFREIENMRKISNHENVIRLEGVLELIQESKCTIFLIMELANGGELFDRIKVDCGTRESTAKYFFQQLLEGVQHCHGQGVCHRDLKPENLLLQDAGKETVLKIADFGFSARFLMGNANSGGEESKARSQYDQQVMHSGQTPIAPPSLLEEYSPLRMLKSVVGSPFYVAPEVLQARGYDGPKADIWSLGVILYAMLAGNLPFGQELATCKRFRHFCKWVREQQQKHEKFWEAKDLEYPPWLFPARFSVLAKGLIVSMLHPDPACRISIAESMQHELCYRERPQPTVDVDSVAKVITSNTTMDSTENVDAMVELASQMSIANEEQEDEGAFFHMEDEADGNGNDSDSSQNSQHDESRQQTQKEAPVSQTPSSAIPVPITNSVFNIGPVTSPPPAPVLERSNSIDDLVLGDDEMGPSSSGQMVPVQRSEAPPAFSDLVKRSTRFLTSVPAADVLNKVEGLLRNCQTGRTETPVGYIGKVVVNWDIFRLEVWGEDVSGPPLSALQLYLMPSDTAMTLNIAASPSPHSALSSSYGAGSGQAITRSIFMVEFIRGELEIFIFKRFYQWVREKISELVKRDWEGSNMLSYMSPSPRLDSAVLQQYGSLRYKL